MQFIYADPGLRNDLGHHANSARLITGELRRRGIATAVFAHRDIEPALCEELGATPHFRWWTYGAASTDPIAGWLTGFIHIANETAQDLGRLPTLGADDIVYLNSSQPPQFMALLQWLRGLPPERRPHVMTEFGTGPGLDHTIVPEGLQVKTRDPRVDPRAVLYRFAAGLITGLDLSRLHLFTFETTSSQLYSYLLNVKVHVLPLPHAATSAGTSRVGRRPITVAVLGHQRPEKGYALMPDIAALLLAKRPDVRLLVHNGEPQNMVATQEQLRVLARTHPQLELDERVAGPELWQALLDRADLILCPYPAWNFSAAYSAVAAEAVAAGIPLVVPAGTTLAALLAQYGGGGTTFDAHNPVGIVAAVEEALNEFDDLARISIVGSHQWLQTMGARNMVGALLDLAAPS